MENVAIYARVSSEDQQERGTIGSQIEFGTKYADLHQISIIKWYKDDGVSGTIPIEERPASARMIEDAKHKSFDTILIYKLDRLGRSARIILNAVHSFEQLGIKVKSMTEPFDTGDSAGRFLLTILAGVADLERSNILDRLWHGANRAARQGKWLGGIVPYGYYVTNDGFLAINQQPITGMEMSEADVVRLLYQLTVEQNMSTIKLADYLNAIGVPPSYSIANRKIRRGKRQENTAGIWRPSRIRNMIVNPTYKGIHEYGKRTKKQREIIKREVPAIIDWEHWERAQLILKSNQLEAMRSAKRLYLLRGLVKCGTCGLNYHGTTMSGNGGNATPYYICNGKSAYRGPLQGKCSSKNIPVEWLENYVWQDCLSFVKSPQQTLAALILKENDEQSNSDILAKQNAILHAVKEKDSEKQSILNLFRKKLITSCDVEKQLQIITKEWENLQQQIRQLEVKSQNNGKSVDTYKFAEQLLTSLHNSISDNPAPKTKRNIIKSLVKEILIKTQRPSDSRPQATITIKYSFTKGINCTDRDSWQILIRTSLGRIRTR